jgi:hypothetical protein
MAEFQVTLAIDVEADTPAEAVRIAARAIGNLEDPVGEVRQHGTYVTVTVDTGEGR